MNAQYHLWHVYKYYPVLVCLLHIQLTMMATNLWSFQSPGKCPFCAPVRSSFKEFMLWHQHFSLLSLSLLYGSKFSVCVWGDCLLYSTLFLKILLYNNTKHTGRMIFDKHMHFPLSGNKANCNGVQNKFKILLTETFQSARILGKMWTAFIKLPNSFLNVMCVLHKTLKKHVESTVFSWEDAKQPTSLTASDHHHHPCSQRLPKPWGMSSTWPEINYSNFIFPQKKISFSVTCNGDTNCIRKSYTE